MKLQKCRTLRVQSLECSFAPLEQNGKSGKAKAIQIAKTESESPTKQTEKVKESERERNNAMAG